jgi:hypothetical protein
VIDRLRKKFSEIEEKNRTNPTLLILKVLSRWVIMGIACRWSQRPTASENPVHFCLGISFWTWHRCASSKSLHTVRMMTYVAPFRTAGSELATAISNQAVNSMLGSSILVSSSLKHHEGAYSVKIEIQWVGSVKPPSNLPFTYTANNSSKDIDQSLPKQKCFKAFLWYKFISRLGFFFAAKWR